MDGSPLGTAIDLPPRPLPRKRLHEGRSVCLQPLAQAHLSALWQAAQGADSSWTYLRYGPFPSEIAMAEQVMGALPEEQVALIRAHPDLGTRARMSSASSEEQAGAGLDHLTLEEYDQLQSLNSAYREKFSFPFIYAVKGSTRQDILSALERRLSNDPAAEHAMALAQIYRIAQNRLEESLHA